MADIHIEEFYRDTAIILVQLYNAFPRKVSLYVEDISGPDSPDEFGLHSRRHRACFSTMLWLADEGHIRYDDTIHQDAVDQVVLTQPAFTRLNAPVRTEHLPDSLTGTYPEDTDGLPPAVQADLATNIHLLRVALKNGNSSLIADAVQSVLFVGN
ncbi:hypothetical protein EZI54_02210 [Marinobacter halodurans]|uniref:DUF4255 domain-containing protein n=1 Tax=Marinobacter halodurans TaxID=2528979 RepID=A0ABY1ZQC3_9GAMM|nr:hypothetical protein [Marinobacter halodurans]TBW59147.1 hypothetical protein EZI54_02210 [Marinobacter halodurans]